MKKKSVVMDRILGRYLAKLFKIRKYSIIKFLLFFFNENTDKPVNLSGKLREIREYF